MSKIAPTELTLHTKPMTVRAWKYSLAERKPNWVYTNPLAKIVEPGGDNEHMMYGDGEAARPGHWIIEIMPGEICFATQEMMEAKFEMPLETQEVKGNA